MRIHLRTTAIVFLSLFAGCLGCFLLHVQLGWSPILSAAALGFGVTFLPLPRHWDARAVQFAFAAGTFIGMSSSRILANPLEVAGVSVMGTAIVVLGRPFLNGIGGKLGAMAFLTTAVWLLLLIRR